MPDFDVRKTRRYRLVQFAVITFSAFLIALGVLLGLKPYGDSAAAIFFAVAGALTLALGLRGLDIRASANRQRYTAHIGQVRSQVALLAGTTGARQGVVLSDWRNARWRDEGERGGRSTYNRLPLLVPQTDVNWPVSNTSKTNTGVPIDEISGMDVTLEHLQQSGRGLPSVETIVHDSRLCLQKWGDFDAQFEAKALALAEEKFIGRATSVEVGWESTPWFAPIRGRWRLGGEGLVYLATSGEPQIDRPTLHPMGTGDLSWFVRLGKSSIWLLMGPEPIPDGSVEIATEEIVSRLTNDSELRSSFRLADEAARNLWIRVNAVRADLPNYDVESGSCHFCDSIWILAPTPA